jgi:hypothetical protein
MPGLNFVAEVWVQAMQFGNKIAMSSGACDALSAIQWAAGLKVSDRAQMVIGLAAV